ncbi:hypothetical protein [Acidithiobacillus sp.]|jgi:hypothetical protein|nr:hypothetical protein GCD22_00156 [Acidithiobacillus thiooxidans ATCC 19377]
MAVLFITLWGWRFEDLRASLHKEFRYKGEIALRSIADQLAGNLDGHFHDLTFFAAPYWNSIKTRCYSQQKKKRQ